MYPEHALGERVGLVAEDHPREMEYCFVVTIERCPTAIGEAPVATRVVSATWRRS
ncbi:MAG: hypothetical protein ACRDPZ_13915 [Gaiellaceae bacterium]